VRTLAKRTRSSKGTVRFAFDESSRQVGPITGRVALRKSLRRDVRRYDRSTLVGSRASLVSFRSCITCRVYGRFIRLVCASTISISGALSRSYSERPRENCSIHALRFKRFFFT